MENGLIVALVVVVACGVVAIRNNIRRLKARANEAKEKQLELEKQRSEQELRELRLVQPLTVSVGEVVEHKKKRKKGAKLKAGA